jgi:putative ABC transport system ATP-binding protein
MPSVARAYALSIIHPPMSSTSIVRVASVHKRYRQGAVDVHALRGVSLDVECGSFISIMGASGSGKSTLLHLLAGLTQADEGSVHIDNTDLTGLSDHALTLFRRRRIGLIFQSFNLIPTLTARENMMLPLMLDGKTDRASQHRVDELLEKLGMRKRSHHRPDALSGGEQQRIAIGRALVTEPVVILADEPTGNLDSHNSRVVCELLRDLSSEQGRTIIMVTHEAEVAAFTKQVIVLRDGSIVDRFEGEGFLEHHSERFSTALARTT